MNDQDDSMLVAAGVLAAILLGLAGLIYAAKAHADTPPTLNIESLSLNLYQSGRPLPEALSVDLPLGGKQFVQGMADVQIPGWDLDEPNEGGIQVGSCAEVRFPSKAIPSNDSLAGVYSLQIPAPCFVRRPEMDAVKITFTHYTTNGFRITGLKVWMPSQPAPVAPVISYEGDLMNRGLLPSNWARLAEFHPAPITVAVAGFSSPVLIAPVCLTDTKGTHAVITTSAPNAANWLFGRKTAWERIDGFCAQSWAACWPREQPQCN